MRRKLLDSDEPEYRGKTYYRGSRIIVWNHETLHHVSDVNVLEKLNEFTFYESTGNDFDVVHFAMAKGKLAVNIEVIYENSPRLKLTFILIRWSKQNFLGMFQFLNSLQIWNQNNRKLSVHGIRMTE